MKIACLYDFLRKNQFLPIFYTQNGHFPILWVRSHYDVIVTSFINGWYLFWYQMERRCPYLYSGSKFRVIWPSVLIIQRGVATTPLRKIRLGKPSGEQGLNILHRERTHHTFMHKDLTINIFISDQFCLFPYTQYMQGRPIKNIKNRENK